MADGNQNFQCSGNCLNCLPAQRAYCAAQHSYSNMKVLDKVMEIVIDMKGDIKAISEKIQAMQDNEALLFDPSAREDDAEPKPQSFQQRTTIAQ